MITGVVMAREARIRLKVRDLEDRNAKSKR